MKKWEEIENEIRNTINSCNVNLCNEQIENSRIKSLIEKDSGDYKDVDAVIENEEKLEYYSDKIDEIEELGECLEDLFYQVEHLDDDSDEKRMIEVEIEDLYHELSVKIAEDYIVSY